MAETLADTINSLTPEQQERVRKFVEFLRNDTSEDSPILQAAEEFIEEHPELLRRLAQ